MMKASITKGELDRVLNIVLKGMSSRSTLPILSGIYISADEDSLTFQTTDLEISIKSKVKAFVEEQGTVVASGKLLSNIVKSLPDAAIAIGSDDGRTIQVECGSSLFELISLDPADFPLFPTVNPEQVIKVPSGKLSQMVKRVGKCVSKDESRAVITGILFSVEGWKVKLVATDSYRLAVDEEEFAMDKCDPLEVIIPGQTFTELMKSAENEDYVSVGVTENQIVFIFGETTFISRKIEGNYPPFMQLITGEGKTIVTADTEQLFEAVKRVSLMSQQHTPIKMSVSKDEQCIKLISQSSELGRADDRVEADVVGEDIEIGFNYQYILDGLSSISSEKTTIELQEPLKPGIFRNEDKTFLYLAMPIRLG